MVSLRITIALLRSVRELASIGERHWPNGCKWEKMERVEGEGDRGGFWVDSLRLAILVVCKAIHVSRFLGVSVYLGGF